MVEWSKKNDKSNGGRMCEKGTLIILKQKCKRGCASKNGKCEKKVR